MRTIKFRALKDDMSDHRWVYGHLTYDASGNPRIQTVDGGLFHTCIKGTECEFIGLHDRNGREIYEGDILGGATHGNSVVKWDNEYGCWHSGFDLIGNEIKDMPERVVIGNLYETPELLTK